VVNLAPRHHHSVIYVRKNPVLLLVGTVVPRPLWAALSWEARSDTPADGVSDLLFGRQQTPQNITIIAIDEGSIHSVGQWPWPRAVVAVLFLNSTREGIGVDINIKNRHG